MKKLALKKTILFVFLILAPLTIYFGLININNKDKLVRETPSGFIYRTNHINDWIDPSFLYQEEEEINKDIQKILTSQIKVSDQDSNLAKLIKIGKFVLEKLDNKRGTPTKLEVKGPYDLWLKINQGKTKVWCHHFVQAYSLFANNSGLPTRIVGIQSIYQGKVQDHVLAESYVSQKLGWIMVDLTQGFVYLREANGKYLNASETLLRYSDKANTNLILHDGSQERRVNSKTSPGLKENLAKLLHEYLNESTTLGYSQFKPEYKDRRLRKND
jgi:hypothetical protein